MSWSICASVPASTKNILKAKSTTVSFNEAKTASTDMITLDSWAVAEERDRGVVRLFS